MLKLSEMFEAFGPTIALPVSVASIAIACVLGFRLHSKSLRKIRVEQLAEVQARYEAEIRWRSATEPFEMNQRSLAHIAVEAQPPSPRLTRTMLRASRTHHRSLTRATGSGGRDVLLTPRSGSALTDGRKMEHSDLLATLSGITPCDDDPERQQQRPEQEPDNDA
jgi:hypothetical protein